MLGKSLDMMGKLMRDVVTDKYPAPSREDLFAVMASARMDGGRQPDACKNCGVFTNDGHTVMHSSDDEITIRDFGSYLDVRSYDGIGAARLAR